MVVPLPDHSSAAARAAYRVWTRFFGTPQFVRADLGGEFAKNFADRCMADGSELDPASLEAPTQNSITERAGKTFKGMFAKASMEYGHMDEEEVKEMVDSVCVMKNR